MKNLHILAKDGGGKPGEFISKKPPNSPKDWQRKIERLLVEKSSWSLSSKKNQKREKIEKQNYGVGGNITERFFVCYGDRAKNVINIQKVCSFLRTC